MLDLKRIAQEVLTLSELMIDREKLTTEEIIENGGEITIIDAEPTSLTKPNGKIDETWVFITKEYKGKFSFAGVLLKRIMDRFVERANGDVNEVRESLQKCGLKVRLTRGTTKGNNNDITYVELI